MLTAFRRRATVEPLSICRWSMSFLHDMRIEPHHWHFVLVDIDAHVALTAGIGGAGWRAVQQTALICGQVVLPTSDDMYSGVGPGSMKRRLSLSCRGLLETRHVTDTCVHFDCR